MHQRLGMTIPFDGVALSQQRDWICELESLGYSDLWSAEANGSDGITPLALASQWAPSMRLGTAIIPAFTRGPALLAQTAATMAEAAPGRFIMGLGTSSNVIVGQWNGIPFDKPYARVRDSVQFLKSAFAGEKIDHAYETFTVKGFKLGRRLDQAPKIMIAGLREGMLRLAGRESDGAIVNWLGANNVAKVNDIVQGASPDGSAKEMIARLFVCPSEDVDAVRAGARFAIAAYLNVPVYAAFHEWLGNGPRLQGMWDAWKAGDRKAALAAIPDDIVDELVIHGSPAQCKAHIQKYQDNGITTAALAILPLAPFDLRQVIRELAPST